MHKVRVDEYKAGVDGNVLEIGHVRAKVTPGYFGALAIVAGVQVLVVYRSRQVFHSIPKAHPRGFAQQGIRYVSGILRIANPVVAPWRQGRGADSYERRLKLVNKAEEAVGVKYFRDNEIELVV